MLTESVRQEKDKLTKEDRIKELEERIAKGKSASRLMLFPDWQKLESELRANLDLAEKGKIAQYDFILDQQFNPITQRFDPVVTVEEKLKAVDRMQRLNSSIQSLKYLLDLPATRVKEGEDAEKELELLKKEEEGK